MTPGPVHPLAGMRHHNFPDESERRRNPHAETRPNVLRSMEMSAWAAHRTSLLVEIQAYGQGARTEASEKG